MIRQPLDLIDRDWVFSQRRLLDDDAFISAARDQGVSIWREDLEALHRARLLEPMYGVRRDGREILAALRQGHPSPISTMRRRYDLLALKGEGRLFDPALSPFRARARDRRATLGFNYDARWYIYSVYQVPFLPEAIRYLREESAWHRRSGAQVARDRRAQTVALTALEPVMYSDVIRAFTLPDFRGEKYRRWLWSRPVPEILEWLGVEATWLNEAGAELRQSADHVDPMRGWLDLISEISPRRWEELRGSARLALERRIASEMMFRAAEESTGDAPRKSQALERRERRLGRASHLDPVLTRYGISPHPRLVLVVEGDVELELLPRVMSQLGMRSREDLIQIVNRRGVDKSIDALVDHALALRLDQRERDGWVAMQRPMTRMLIVTDPEGKMADGKREEEVDRWQRQLLSRIEDVEIRKAVAERAIDDLLRVEVWDDSGKSFEFVHFSDAEIAAAVVALDNRPAGIRRPTVQALTTIINGIRERDGNLQPSVLDHARTSKTKLAKHLWPLLEAKIEAAIESEDVGSIPAARVLLAASRLAHEFPRGGLGLRVGAPEEPRPSGGEDR